MANSTEFTRTYTYHDPTEAAAVGRTMAGLDYMRALIAGEYPTPPIADTLGYRLVEVDHGSAAFEGQPDVWLMNPIGVVHGGYAMTLLDSALGCAIHTTLPAGVGYTTVQVNVNLVRPILPGTGVVRAEARVIHAGRQIATAEGMLKDSSGKLLAHATTTCAIFPLREIG
ncbi:MAG: PaaI family thioesterase [Chloroflexi bacterium]|nr:PaaI family thioesterase [Chloroflexota bacterium]